MNDERFEFSYVIAKDDFNFQMQRFDRINTKANFYLALTSALLGTFVISSTNNIAANPGDCSMKGMALAVLYVIALLSCALIIAVLTHIARVEKLQGYPEDLFSHIMNIPLGEIHPAIGSALHLASRNNEKIINGNARSLTRCTRYLRVALLATITFHILLRINL